MPKETLLVLPYNPFFFCQRRASTASSWIRVVELDLVRMFGTLKGASCQKGVPNATNTWSLVGT
jgi:hypothetical protein